MKFFFDNNLSQHLAAGMLAFGENVEHLQESFPEDTDDEIWLKYIGENGLFLITRDEQIRYRPSQKAALKANNVGAFFLGGKNRTRWQLVKQLVRSWERIKEFAAKERRPFAFKIYAQGTKFVKIPLD